MENIKPVLSSEIDKLKTRYSPFVKEIRKRVLFTVYFFMGSTFVGFIFYEQIIKFLVDLLSLQGINIVFTSPFQFINLSVSCGVAVGLVAVFPVIIYQILSFLKPALKEKEYKTVTRFLPFSIFLFLIGFIFGAIIMKWQIEIFLARSVSLGIGNILDISRLLSVVLLTSALLGVGFQFPIVLLLLMRLKIISQRWLSKKRPWVYLGSFIFALFLPPDSILADVFLSLPLIALFEFTLLINYLITKNKVQQLSITKP